MSLIAEMMESCKIMNRARLDDGLGGYTETWTEGATFNAAIIKETSTETQIAEKQGVKEIFSVVAQSGFDLDYHDVFKRLSDGQIFRVTGRLADSEAPERSTVKIGKAPVEKWVLT